MSENKTTLFSLWKQDWRTVKSETEKVNNLLANIPTKAITELNDLIYAGAKLVCKKIEVLLKTKVLLKTESRKLGGNADLNHR